MITIGCAGFPVPATRYFREFVFVEVQDTHVAQPGTGTIRRWRREAPEGFGFALMAPREIGQEGFRPGKITENAVKAMLGVAKELDAFTAVFTAPGDFAPNRANKSALKEFLAGVKKKFKRIVWEPPPTWDADEAQSIASESGAIAARDPLASGTAVGAGVDFGYYRLPGPAGHKSRYEDPAIEKLGEIARAGDKQQLTFVFTNVDMFADAKRLKRAILE
jgi:uncharacterized protein YecE (DUF72 family)